MMCKTCNLIIKGNTRKCLLFGLYFFSVDARSGQILLRKSGTFAYMYNNTKLSLRNFTRVFSLTGKCETWKLPRRVAAFR